MLASLAFAHLVPLHPTHRRVRAGAPERSAVYFCNSVKMSRHAEISFQARNARGERLAGLLTKPRGADEGRCVVLAHGFRDSMWGQLVSALSEEMDWTQTVRFDMSGNGKSDGEFRFSNYAEECEDLRAIVEHVRKEFNITVDCIVGHSKAGGAVLMYASKYGDVPHVVNLAGRFDMARGVVERFGEAVVKQVKQDGSAEVQLKDGFKFTLTEEALLGRIQLDMAPVARGIPELVHVLSIHGSDDQVIPVADAHEFEKLISNHRLIIVPGASHNFSGNSREVAAHIRTFLTGSEIQA